VNDVLVAATANGLRQFLIRRDERIDDYDARTMIPVSLRRDKDAADNQISAVFIDLPVAAEDPVERLRAVSAQTKHLKERHGEVALESLLQLARYVPPPIFRIGEGITWRLTGTERLMNTVTTNVPGPQTPFYCLGRRMLELYPYVLLPKNIRLTTAIFSYDGGVFFGITADRESVPDAEIVARGIERELADLAATVSRAESRESESRRGSPGSTSRARRRSTTTSPRPARETE
jgi:WS/DGAT/MGAT family acyltransferase